MLLENSSSSLVWPLLFFISLHPSGCVPIDSVLVPFAGLVRERLLYTDGRNQGFFLEIVADGSVRASPDPSSNCVLELRSVKPGETVIRGVAASLFLCVNPAGHLRGQWHYAEEDCTFRELLVDSYTMFLSPHTSLPVSLRSKRSGKKRGHLHLSHFLPVINPGLLTEEEDRQEIGVGEESGVNSEDPLGFGRMSRTHSIVSPSMHRKKKR
ncbi:fibroblast growth factor 21 [Colossoma macropomum]|uniref:fibroblast growth factor 21 n=1 Tax=Colossoma macropomum TaxID=42526 RepID=UPI0018649495|nr:fibroblast growth factor 21 [Colossoma macropomum]